MGATNFKKFKLLLWKNYLLQKRHKLQTVLEIVLPLIFVSILAGFRDAPESSSQMGEMGFEPFNPSEWNSTVIWENLAHQRLASGTPYFNENPYNLFFTPKNPSTIEIMNFVQENFLQFDIEQLNRPGRWYHYQYNVTGFDSEEALIEAYKQPDSNLLGAVVFSSLDPVQYSLRLPPKQRTAINSSTVAKDRWNTDRLFPAFQLLGPRSLSDNRGGSPGYSSQGFTFLQYALDASIIHHFTNVSVQGLKNFSSIGEFEIQLQRFPYPAFIDDPFLLILQRWLPLILVMSFIYPVMNTTKCIVIEKEKRLKESMKIMGLSNHLHWLAWFVKSSLFLLVSSSIIVLMLKIKFAKGVAVLTYTNAGVLLLFLACYAVTGITFSFLISVIFSKANNGSTAAGLVWFLTYFPYFFIQPRYDSLSQATKIFTSLFSNTGMAFGCQLLTMGEGTGVGVQWGSMAHRASLEDSLSFLQIILMLLFDAFLYLVLALYIDKVRPGEFGVPLPWYFPFQKSYWLRRTYAKLDGVTQSFTEPDENENVEPSSTQVKAGIRVRGLTKAFGDKLAVSNLSFDLYENQITALLGHNGAGKTTFMSMVTGLYTPSAGTAILGKHDIRTSMKYIRDSLGLCPQHDVLFDELTVEEHLKFFCLLKDYPDFTSEINRMLKALELEDKRHAQARTLSGGMKRKLSVGIALVGGSKIVLLDEPTSGMDPGARRSTWDLLTSEKRGRTMVLSTHFMEEADLLGDRIAILANGELQTLGSSLYLKKKYGVGYRLIIAKGPGCDPSRITQVLERHLEEAEVEQDIGAELTYSLPDHKSTLFGNLFEELEVRRDELSIDSYGASITTMEEVFVRVAKDAEKKKEVERDFLGVPVDPSYLTAWDLHQVTERNTGLTLLFQQLWALVLKKVLYSCRRWSLVTVQVAAPVVFLLFAIILLNTLPSSVENPSFKVSQELYGRTTTTVSCENHLDLICQNYNVTVKEAGSTPNTTSQSLKGAILYQYSEDVVATNQHFIVGFEKIQNKLKAYFNNQPYHGPAISLNYLTNALFKQYYGPEASITTLNHPLPYSLKDEARNTNLLWSPGFMIGFNITFGMCFLSAGFVVFLIQERVSKVKHLQSVSGVHAGIYWLANVIVDGALFILPCGLIVGLMAVFKPDTFGNIENLRPVLILLVMYGWAIIPLMYLSSFRFSNPSTGFARMTFLNGLAGIGPIIAISIVKMPEFHLENAVNTLQWIFLLSPNYCLCYAIVSISTNAVIRHSCPALSYLQPNFCENNQANPCCGEFDFPNHKPFGYLDFHFAGIGRYLMSLFLIGLISFLVLFVKESKLLKKLGLIISLLLTKRLRRNTKKSDTELTLALTQDSDVVEERARIQNMNARDLFASNNLIIQDLTRRYGSLTAVQSLNLGVRRGECFGLLGVNGAGKTTIFKMLTGDLRPSSGNAFIYGKSIRTGMKEARRYFGYCPQFDALHPELTGRESLKLFARLRGIPERNMNSLAEHLALNLLFTDCLDKRVKTYSGGNKRKLSTAIALIGNPPIVFLDEPTTGMDPVARRHLWNCITKVRDAGTSIVLTSHSMEECEALCTRLAIMVNGEFHCLGSAQHLKSKFGEGYTIIAQLSARGAEGSLDGEESFSRRFSQISSHVLDSEMEALKKYIQDTFPGSTLKESHPGYVHYHVRNPSLSWGDLFRKMESAKSAFSLEAYSVGQTTLEQIFLNFTTFQQQSSVA